MGVKSNFKLYFVIEPTTTTTVTTDDITTINDTTTINVTTTVNDSTTITNDITNIGNDTSMNNNIITTIINDTATSTDEHTTSNNDIANIIIDITITVNSIRFKLTINHTSLTGTNNDGINTIDDSIATNSSTTTNPSNVDAANAKRNNDTTSTNIYINNDLSQPAPNITHLRQYT